MKIKKYTIFCNTLIVLSFVFLSIISVILLLKSKVVYLGMDTQFHFRRIIELYTSLKNGNLPSFSFNEFHGSAVMIAYPYLNLLPVVILSSIIKSKIYLAYLSIIFNVFMSFVISFYSCKNYIKSYKTSYVFSAIYSMSNVFLLHNVIANDFGVTSSYIILPLIIFGFMKFIHGKDSWIQLSLGMSILLYSHFLNLIIVSIFLLLFLLINIRKLNAHIIINLFKSIILFVIITSIIWLPFIHLYFTNLNNINMPTMATLNNVSIKTFMSGLYGSKTDQSIGLFPIIALFISPFFYKKFNRYIKQSYILSLIIVISVLFLPWKLIVSYEVFRPLNQLQFIHRIFIIPLMLLSFIFALIITQYIKSINKKIIISLFTIFIAISLQVIMGQFFMIHNFSKNPSVDNYVNSKDIGANISVLGNHPINTSEQFDNILNNYSESDNDYIPKKSIAISPYVNLDLGFYNKHNQIKINHIGYNTFNFNNKKNINELSLPLYMYNQEKLKVYLNNRLVKYYENKNGLLTIDNVKDKTKQKNKIYVKTIPNVFQIVGLTLSILGWLFVLFIFIHKIYN